MNVLVFAAVFALPIMFGCVAAGFTWLRDRRRMAVAFRRGRAENVARLPQTVEPLPTFGRAS